MASSDQPLLPLPNTDAVDEASPRFWFLSDRRLMVVVIASALLGVAVAPWFCEEADVREFWIPWARATGGYCPWRAYSSHDCIYPPFMIYVLTATEAVQRLAHLDQRGRAFITLIKLPSILAVACGAMLCAAGLGRIIGHRAARVSATAYALCLPLWFNAACWGQCDAILSLALVGVVLSMLNDKPTIAGACIGWALSIKLQAIIILPMAIVYGFRRFGAITVCAMLGMGMGVWVIFALPMVLAGHGHDVAESFTKSVGFYQLLSINAFNPWALVHWYNLHVRQPGELTARSDSVRWIAEITPRQVGLLAFASFTAFLMAGVYLRPTRRVAAMAAALTGYGFYMLPTEMHERYVIPAAAMLAVCAGFGWRANRIYLAVMIPALLNQVAALASENCKYHQAMTPARLRIFDCVSLIVSAANCVIFILICIAWYREAYGRMTTEDSVREPKHKTGKLNRV